MSLWLNLTGETEDWMAVIQFVYQQIISSLAQEVSPVKEEITAWRQAFDVLVWEESKDWWTSVLMHG